MTDQNLTPGQPDTPQSPQEVTVPLPEGALASEDTADSLEATIESPTIPVDSQQPDTMLPPAADMGQSPSDTSDFTLGDITLTDTGGSRLMAWIQDHRPRKGSVAKSGARSAAKTAGKTRRWGLRPWQWALVGVAAVVLIVAVLIGVDTGLYYDKVHRGVDGGRPGAWAAWSSGKAVEPLTAAFARRGA